MENIIVTASYLEDCGYSPSAVRFFENNFPKEGVNLAKMKIIGDCFLNKLPKLYRCPAGHVIKKVDHRGNTYRIKRDKHGNMIQESYGKCRDVYLYDDNNKLISKKLYTINRLDAAYLYNEYGDVILVEERGSQPYTIHYQYDDKYNIVSKRSLGETIKYEYDGRNNKISEIYESGIVLRYVFDNKDNMVKYVDSQGNVSVYIYDNFHNMVGRVTHDNEYFEIVYRHDSKDRLIEAPGYTIEYTD